MPTDGAIGTDAFGSGRREFSPRQREILDVVERVFRRDGVRGVRMGELATEASCSRSTLYELAPSKEDLLLLTLDGMMRRMMRRGADAIAAAEDPVGRIRGMLLSGALDFAELGPSFLEAVRGHTPSRILFDSKISEGMQVLELLIDDAIEAGAFREVNAALVAEAIFAVILRFTDASIVRSTKVSPTAGLAELIDVLIDGLRPR